MLRAIARRRGRGALKWPRWFPDRADTHAEMHADMHVEMLADMRVEMHDDMRVEMHADVPTCLPTWRFLAKALFMWWTVKVSRDRPLDVLSESSNLSRRVSQSVSALLTTLGQRACTPRRVAFANGSSGSRTCVPRHAIPLNACSCAFCLDDSSQRRDLRPDAHGFC